METKTNYPCLSRAWSCSSQQPSQWEKPVRQWINPPPGLISCLAENRDGSYPLGKGGIQPLLESNHPRGMEGCTEALALCGDESARPMREKTKM